MPPAVQRATALGGLVGALAMFVGDMLFYGQWGAGSAALTSSLEIVRSRPENWLVAGGLLSSLAGLGFMIGLLHVWVRSAPAGGVERAILTFLMAGIVSVGIGAHSVWGAFALTGGEHGAIADYLDLFFRAGMIVAVPASLLLGWLVVSGRTTWPGWSAILNPGLLYVVLATASWFPAPLGAAIVGGAFNLAFAAFFTMSLATVRPTGD